MEDEETLITLYLEPEKFPIEERRRLNKKYQHLFIACEMYDPYTFDKVAEIDRKTYLFIRKVYARKNVIIPWVEY